MYFSLCVCQLIFATIPNALTYISSFVCVAFFHRYKELGVSRFADARKVVFTLDHNVQDHSGELKKKASSCDTNRCRSFFSQDSTTYDRLSPATPPTLQPSNPHPGLSEGNLKKYSNIQRFAQENGVDFYPAGRGIGHQVLCEEGYVFPYRMVVASDSHSNMCGKSKNKNGATERIRTRPPKI